MASLDKETEVYYNNYFDLFNTSGYKQLIEDLKSNNTVLNNVDTIKDDKDLYFRKGQLNVLASLINFEVTIDNAYKEATEDD
jgi:3-methyladenine DNA glycosylase AlkC